MGRNAQEVVRVFACTTQFTPNLSRIRYALVANPMKKALITMGDDFGQMKDTFR